MKHHLSIEGVLTAVKPFHLAHANVKGYVDDNGYPRVLRQPTAKIPCVMTYKIPVRAPSEDGGSRSYIPTIPCTSLRGGIRRAAADRIKLEILKKEQMFNREGYHVLQVLSYGAQGIDRSNVSPADFLEAGKDLYAGVFGGGPALFPSTFRTPDAMAVTREMVELGLLPPSAAARGAASPPPPAYECTFAHSFTKRDDLLHFLDPLAPRIVSNYVQSFELWQRTVAENQSIRNSARKSKAAGKKKTADVVEQRDEGDEKSEAVAPLQSAKKVGIDSQMALEAVIPGVEFGFELRVSGSKAQCGMIIASLSDLLGRKDGIGGNIRNGYGKFAADLSMRFDGEPASLLKADGDTSVTISSPIALELVQEFERELAGYSVDQFMRAYMLLDKLEQEGEGGGK